MIVEAILSAFFNVLTLVLSAISIAPLPDDIMSMLETLIEYLAMGFAILSNFVFMEYLAVLFGIVISIELGLFTYKAIMFIVRKIPMIGIQ